MNSKKYVISFLWLVGIFFWGNVCLWYGYTKETLTLLEGHGDLTRMAFLPNSVSAMRNYQPNRKHIEFCDYINMTVKPSVDMITLGDSFSMGGAGAYYQDYIEERYKKNVLNIPMMSEGNPFLVLKHLIATGMLEEIHPRTVVLESVERYAVERFGENTYKYENLTKEKLLEYYASSKKNAQSTRKGIFPGIMVNVNRKMIKYKLKHYHNENRLSDDVYKAVLHDNMFTAKGREDMLLYYHQDLWYKNVVIDYSQINNNLNEMADELQAMGIQLIVMINVDKWDLYYPHIATPIDIPENDFMEKFSEQPRKYEYIDTKAILRKELEKGEKDIYWQDDTHWSWKAQHKVVDVMMETVK